MSKLTTSHKINIVRFVIVPLVIAVGYWYFSNNTNPVAPPTPLVHQEANQNSASTVTQVANVNQLATFTWINSGSWKITKDAIGLKTMLEFAASSSLLPKRVCIYLESDVNIKEVQLIPSSDNGIFTDKPSKEYIFCAEGAINATTQFEVWFETAPSSLRATLLKNDGQYPDNN